MNKSIYLSLAWLVCAGSAQAISISVPKGLIDIAVAKKFPKEIIPHVNEAKEINDIIHNYQRLKPST